jgi:uncharacterized protein YdhG (YjbR/CyaY superfamily)
MAMRTEFDTIDSYIGSFPEDVQAILQKVRETIRAAAPDAVEAIKYAIPTFVWNGNLIHFAGYQNHIGVYPAPVGIEAFKEELAGYKTGKGSIQFPLNKPIPYDLIRRITEFRIAEMPVKEKKQKVAR